MGLDVARIASARDVVAPTPDRRCRLERQQLDVTPHELVRDRHELAEDFLRRFGDSHIVVERLRHLVDAVEAFEQRGRDDDLRLLAEIALQLAADEQIELLIGAPQLDVGHHRHRVVALHQRVEKLVDRDRLVRPVALAEIVALEHARDRVARRQADHALRAELVRPLRVKQDLRLVGIEDLERLLPVRRRVRLDLLAGERRARLVLPGRVADHPGEITDQELDLVAEALEVAQLVDDHRVAEVQVGRGRVQPQLDAQGPSLRELFRQLVLDDQLVAAAPDEFECFLD